MWKTNYWDQIKQLRDNDRYMSNGMFPVTGQAQVIEMDQERDRKTCVQLDLKVTGANRELAQWLANHPRYTLSAVAGWLGCGVTRIHDLRKWAEGGFADDLHPSKKRRGRQDDRTIRRAEDPELKSLENLEDGIPESADSEFVESPEVIEDNVLHTLQRGAAVASATKKIIKVSSLDREAKARISEAIERLIAKWRSTQATLTRKDQS